MYAQTYADLGFPVGYLRPTANGLGRYRKAGIQALKRLELPKAQWITETSSPIGRGWYPWG